jgi:hypothetical protein
MPIPFPGAAVPVEIPFLVHFTATFTDKYPDFTFPYLDAKHRIVIRFAASAGLCFHGELWRRNGVVWGKVAVLFESDDCIRGKIPPPSLRCRYRTSERCGGRIGGGVDLG